MTKDISTKRKYNSSWRKAQSRETQVQIAEAARKLFVKRGYAGTSIESIAKEAGALVLGFSKPPGDCLGNDTSCKSTANSKRKRSAAALLPGRCTM